MNIESGSVVSESNDHGNQGNLDNAGYTDFLARIQARFLANLDMGGKVSASLFTTDATGLFELYLANLDRIPGDRQYHTCHACRRFIETYGGLVTIDANGRTTSAIWHANDATPHYSNAIEEIAQHVHRAKVMGVFLSSNPTWGTPITGTWTHFAVTPPAAIIHKHSVLTAGQEMAEKREDFGTIMRALIEFTPSMLDQALRLLESDSLYRAEKVVGPARWLRDLHTARDAARGHNARHNVVWQAIASAPAGFCHPRSSMIGTLLEDIAAGMDFAEVSRRFAVKMHPLQYQRPQSAPSAGNIATAEKIIAKLAAEGSLDRRFARLDEIQAIWRPAPAHPAPRSSMGGVFGHLIPKDVGPARMPIVTPPAQTMTWVKFRDVILPTAESIEFYTDKIRDNFSAIVTAANPNAPPILQWGSRGQTKFDVIVCL